jgi:hypothetical protein
VHDAAIDPAERLGENRCAGVARRPAHVCELVAALDGEVLRQALLAS